MPPNFSRLPTSYNHGSSRSPRWPGTCRTARGGAPLQAAGRDARGSYARFPSRNLLASPVMQEGMTIRHLDGRVELREPEAVRGSRLYNEDLAPVPIARRTWSTWDYAALWISMAHCIPTYTLASSM